MREKAEAHYIARVQPNSPIPTNERVRSPFDAREKSEAHLRDRRPEPAQFRKSARGTLPHSCDSPFRCCHSLAPTARRAIVSIFNATNATAPKTRSFRIRVPSKRYQDKSCGRPHSRRKDDAMPRIKYV